MRTSTTLRLILGCLLHITWGSASDSCFKGNVLPINISQMNGLWNIKAVALPQSSKIKTLLNKLHYSYTKISLTEEGGSTTEFFNPMTGMFFEPDSLERVHGEESLTYRKKDDKDSMLFTFFQLHPDVFIRRRQVNGIVLSSGLYVRSSSHPESKLEEFQEWGKCNELTFIAELNTTVDFAQTCHGYFEEKTHLHLEKNEDIFTSWHLVAKSSSSMDQHYNVRSLYTARLEICKKEQTLKEIISAPEDNIVHELKFDKPSEDGNLTLTFKTEDGLLLLGVKGPAGITLYLASRTPTVKRSVIDKFKAQALCLETEYNYFIPGSIREDDAGAEACAHNLEKWVPINFRESVGKWILTVSAYENTQMVLQEFLSPYGSTEITVIDDKVHFSHISIYQGSIITIKDIDVEESTGHIVYKGDNPETRAAIYSVSPNCIVLSPEGQRLYLVCRANHFPSIGDISQFVNYAACRNYNKVLIRQAASFLCSEMPSEVPTLDVEKITGTWKLAAVASNIPESAVNFPSEIQFTVNNEEVTITDGTWTSTAKKIGNNRLKYAKGDENAMEMRFHQPLGDSLLTWVGNPTEQKVFLVLFSKSGHAGPEEIIRFKHFAACLSIPVIFVKE